MTEDAMQRVLRLVGEGRLTADEAGPILDALDERQAGSTESRERREPRASAQQQPRFARIEVVEAGRKSVDLLVPLAVGRAALSRIPGLSSAQAAEIDEAILEGVLGPIVDLQDDDGDGVKIVLE
jgi:hypothetical protein